MTRESAQVVVVGGGITGRATAHALLADAPPGSRSVTVLEAQPRLGGKIRTTPFAGLPAVDEGPDAFLARVPEATGLARSVGLGDHLVSPATGSASVWWDGLQPIPAGLVLGLPTDLMRLARSRLIGWGGKLRAATEVLRPRSNVDHDSVGAYVRERFGDQVHERLVDPLVGSIYAADTDRFSLRAVPQLAQLAGGSRSVLLAARHRPPAPAGPIFFAPAGGMGELVDHTAAAITELGGDIRLDAACQTIERDGDAWRVDGQRADAVVLACPAAQAARLLHRVSVAADPLAAIEYADVVLVTLAIPRRDWPERLLGSSGYLVPKPVQQLVTAVSFASQKWAHLDTDEHVVLRISLGRDGLPVLHLSDEQLLAAALTEVGGHLGIDLQPTDVRLSTWQRAFPQYRPHHDRLVAEIESQLPPTMVLAGASYHGI
ncbi:MAG: protoporphyrinogen oxidase, partial [Actinobacteria bacterium]|nr:protoporphyrinogen oxidase [Actinomycetota bacterium]